MESPSPSLSFDLTNESGSLKATVLTFGATISHLYTKDATGQMRDVVLGFDSAQEYRDSKNPAYFGCICGRVVNRIAKGEFTLNGKKVKLDCNINDGKTHLHGGFIGFSHKEWKVLGTPTKSSVTLRLLSENGDQGYPGTLTTVVTYTISEANELHIKYSAELDPLALESTIINVTNHSYFNLSGLQNEEDKLITDHFMVTSSDIQGVIVKDELLVPTGELIPLTSQKAAGLDFTEKPGAEIHTIGDRIDSVGGYDHGFALKEKAFHQDLIKVWSNKSGIMLTLSTSEPCCQFYTGDSIPSNLKSKKSQANGSIQLGPRTGFCLEAQRFPNAINIPEWAPQVILTPGQKYSQHTIYKFENIASGASS